MNGIKAAFADELALCWFEAMYDDSEEAAAEHAIHADRMRSRSSFFGSGASRFSDN